jgi:hypothetical protein
LCPRGQEPEEVYLEGNLYVLELAVNDLLGAKDLAGKCHSTLIRVGPRGDREMVLGGEGRILISGSVVGVRHDIYISDNSIDPVAGKAVRLP